tara:strand:+ start:122 stop:481 length:360 start_codon:yes stop_codon:yes gene_type:complete
MIAVLMSMSVAQAALRLGAPKLDVRFPRPRFVLQADEFDMAWHAVWSAYFEEGKELDDFLAYFLENACNPPLKIAVEEVPYGLLVCARKCKEGYVPVFKELKNGTRVRKCKRESSLNMW